MLVKLIRELMAGITTAPGQPTASQDDAGQLRLARARYEAGDLVVARELYEAILRRDADHPEAQYYLGVILGRAGRYAAAEALLGKVVTNQPHSADALNALGNVVRLQERPQEAEKLYRRALAINAQAAPLWANLGLCLHDTDKCQEAIVALQRALELKSQYPDALVNLAMVWNDLGDDEQARALLLRAVDLDSNFAEAHMELAHILLRREDYAAGWSEYDWRRRVEKWEFLANYPCPVWQGQALVGKNLLVTAEQGLGDQIMFASCLREVLRGTSHCIIESHPWLTGLFRRSFPGTTVCSIRVTNPVVAGDVTIVPDFKIAIGSLPSLVRRQRSDFPLHQGYLRADSALIERWHARLAQLGPKCKIGISWRGGTSRTRRTKRSIDLMHWLPLLQQEGCQFVSLQYGAVNAELAALARDHGIHVDHWQPAIDDYDETAALVCALDLVISVQTAVVHLAGALGKPAWVLVPSSPEWRYMASGTTMPWYPSVRLFRQRQHEDWQPVISAVAGELAQRLQS